MLAGLRKRLLHMNFDRKMRLFIFLAIGVTAVTILAASTAAYVDLTSRTSQSLIESQLHAVSTSLQGALDGYKNTAIALTLDDSVQGHLKSEFQAPDAYFAGRIGARQSLVNVMNMQPSMNFMALIKDDLTDAIYCGNTTLTTSQLYERFDEDRGGSRPAGPGTMRINFRSGYYFNDPYTVSVYQPIYDTNRVGKEIGLLCFSVREPMLEQILDMQDAALEFQLFLVDGAGRVVSSSTPESIGDTLDIGLTRGRSGAVEQGGLLYLYERMGPWDYYVVGAISRVELYLSGLGTALALIAAIIVMVIVSLVIGSRIVGRSYRAMEDVVASMEAVSGGRLDVAMDEEVTGDDFRKIAQGFNHMMGRLGRLMEQVKEEERQAEQIRFNALQSQIQPHFLYNTLECIHWQSASNGDRETSKMVKALATYYRICLSKGHDIIPLSQEIAHIRSYLTIQNMRYDNIVEALFTVEERFYQVSIPKMTLQPLIENSIYHGIKNTPGRRGQIIVGAREEGGDVVVFIRDNGLGMTEEALEEMNRSIPQNDESFGYGVRNVHRRIEILFGKGYGLHYHSNEPGGLTVEIRLPGLPAPNAD